MHGSPHAIPAAWWNIPISFRSSWSLTAASGCDCARKHYRLRGRIVGLGVARRGCSIVLALRMPMAASFKVEWREWCHRSEVGSLCWEEGRKRLGKRADPMSTAWRRAYVSSLESGYGRYLQSNCSVVLREHLLQIVCSRAYQS
jgi:hypothetical protein